MRVSSALLLVLLLPVVGWAQDPAPPEADAVDAAPVDEGWGPAVAPGSSLDAAWRAYEERQLVTGRRLAEAALVEDPESLRARFLLGWFLYQGEGDLPRARWHLEQVVSRSDAGRGTEGPTAWRFPALALNQLIDLSGAMDDRRAQLAWLDTYNARFSPPRVSDYAWPLLKLGRYDDARGRIAEALASDETWERVHAQNAQCAVEAELGQRASSLVACEAALKAELDAGLDPSVGASNLVSARLANLVFDGLEDVAKQGTLGTGEEVANPWQQLMLLSLTQGRGADAVVRARDMQRWRLRLPPYMRDQNRAELDLSLALLLLAAGETERGLSVVDRAIRYPDRLGYSSGQTDQTLGSATLVRLALRAADEERRAERAPDEVWWQRAWRWVTSWLPDPVALRDRATLRGIVQDRERASGLFRVYLYDGLAQVPPWLLGEAIVPLGVGVASASLDRARAADADSPGTAAYYDAIGAEIAWRAGDRAGAVALGQQALAALPAFEVLLRARTEAVVADAAWWAGNTAIAVAAYEAALAHDGGVLRRLQIALPARVTGGGSADADALVARLARSPRLADSQQGFVVDVRGSGATLSACLLTPTRQQVRCGRAGDVAGEDPVARAADAFHRRVFAMPLGLSTVDWDSLDGTTTVANEAAADAVDDLLDGL